MLHTSWEDGCVAGAGREGVPTRGNLSAIPCHPQVPGKYTVVMDDEKGGSDTLAMRSGDMVEVVEEGTEGLW